LRERHLVELVDADGAAIGTATVAQAHAEPGALHRAFSVLLFDECGNTLLQQRSAAKTRFALRWANTCCGHPEPGEDVVVAARRRLGQELGVRDVSLSDSGVYTYRATDPSTGRVEHEYDHVLVGRVRRSLTLVPDPGEVAGTRWLAGADLLGEVATGSGCDSYAPWLAGVLSVALTSMDM
jgi:isopentenyl-diphosphate delta-isomerase